MSTERRPDVLGEGDVTVVLLPLTPATRGSFGPVQIARLREGSLLVVASRGDIVDEDAVLEAVRSGRVAGAAFDVFEEEPLPASSPLWDEPSILPHPPCRRNHRSLHGAVGGDRDADLGCVAGAGRPGGARVLPVRPRLIRPPREPTHGYDSSP